MAATPRKASNFLRALFVLALAQLCAAAAHARQATPSPRQTPAQRTGRSYDTAPPARKTAPPAPQSPSPVVFKDVTSEVGINFKHNASPTSQKYLPETMGAGVALFD